MQFTKVFTQLADDSSKLPVSGEEVTSDSGKSRRRYTDPEDPMGELTRAVSKNNRFRRTLAKKATLLKNTQRTRQAERGGSGGGSTVARGQRTTVEVFDGPTQRLSPTRRPPSPSYRKPRICTKRRCEGCQRDISSGDRGYC